jgi:4-hydroxy-tetrahydrodipicolinate synthase
MKENIFKGIIPPMVTPLRDNDTLDVQGLERLVEHIIDGGVHGLFILGTTGEAPALSYQLRHEMIKRVCRQAGGRLPILVGITDTAITESLKVALKAADYGADAVVAAPPYYYKPNQKELTAYFRYLADESSLPVFLYNMPSHTKVNFEPETVKNLADHPNIIGFKDSSANVIYFQKVVRLVEDHSEFSLLVGPEEILMQTMLSGGHGGVNGGANMFPELYVNIYEAVLDEDFGKMNKLQKRILAVSETIYTLGNSSASYLQGVKSTLSLMGICNDYMAKPFQAFSDEKRDEIQSFLEEMELIEA